MTPGSVCRHTKSFSASTFPYGPCDVADLTWFLAYCHYKTAATISVIAKRNRKLAEPEPSMVIAVDSVSDVMMHGEEILSGVSL